MTVGLDEGRIVGFVGLRVVGLFVGLRVVGLFVGLFVGAVGRKDGVLLGTAVAASKQLVAPDMLVVPAGQSWHPLLVNNPPPPPNCIRRLMPPVTTADSVE